MKALKKTIKAAMLLAFIAALSAVITACGGADGNEPSITTTSLADGTFGATYSQVLAATGVSPVAWELESGSLPDGLSLAESTGAITGIPAAAGTFNFTVKAVNEAGSDTKQFSIFIAKAPGGGIVTMSGWTYGGEAASPVPDGVYDGNVTYEYKVQGADNSTYTANKPENAGSYTVRAVFEEGTNYLSSTATDSFTISKAAGAAVQGLSGAAVTQYPTGLTLEDIAYTFSGQLVEYAVSTSGDIPPNGWQNSTEFSGLTPNTDYWLFARAAANANYLAGAGGAVVIIEIKTLAEPEALYQNGVYLVGSEVEIPAGFAVTGPNGSITIENGTVTLESSGNYTAVNGGVIYNFTALTSGAYGRLIAPFNGQQTGTSAIAIIDLDASGLTFGYDAAEGAWRYTTMAASLSGRAEVQIVNASELGLKITTNYSAYSYYAIDLKFTAKPDNVSFRRTGDNPTQYWQLATSSDVHIYNQAGEEAAWANVVPGEWYTAYLSVTASIRPERFMSAASVGASDYWIKNLRFENAVPVVPVALYQNGIYITGDKVLIPAGFAVTGPNGSITTENGTVTLESAGNYTAVNGGVTYNFTALTSGAYGRLIDPFNGQSEGSVFSVINSGYGTAFDYDATEGAWRYTTDKAVSSATGLGNAQISISGAPASKLLANSYGYVALDIKYTAAVHDLAFRKNGTSNYWFLGDSDVYIYNQAGELVSFGELNTGEWYTVYVKTNAYVIRPDRFMNASDSAGPSDLLIKYLRFENALPV